MKIEHTLKATGNLPGLLSVLFLLASAYVALIGGLPLSDGARVLAATDENGATTLRDLKSVDELKAIFNEDKGDPRLLVLLSPT